MYNRTTAFSSFVRQLNYYGEANLSTGSNAWESRPPPFVWRSSSVAPSPPVFPCANPVCSSVCYPLRSMLAMTGTPCPVGDAVLVPRLRTVLAGWACQCVCASAHGGGGGAARGG